ncbi:response regulator [Blautia sp.]|uniref:Stage 0 sporulation protein A homolog n=1 Tax=Blautia glucerasea TaxID=536633 RepID=A0A6N2VG38_9FIRM
MTVYQVLIVDDEEIVCRGLARFVKWEKYGFQVAGTAASGEEALSILGKKPIDLIFMDIRMPQMTGLELLKLVKEQYPQTKCVILSGYSDFSYAQEAIRNGASDYLTKPVVLKDIETLLERLSSEFTHQQKESLIHTNRMEALLLSAVKGYSHIDPHRYDLPNLKQWYGLSMLLKNKSFSQMEIDEKKQQMRSQISSVIPSAIFLDDELSSLFALLPWESDTSFDSLTALLEQLCFGLKEWSCGASSLKYGFGELQEGWEESRKAQLFHQTKPTDSIILYSNIKQNLACTPTPALDISREVPDEKNINKDVIQEIQNFICCHYAENISLNSLAEQFYLHPNYLSRLFKEKTGHNFVEYLTEIRMEKVKELLRSSNKKIIEICDMTGYDNPRYFSKVFKQYTGMTPREYRDNLPPNP